MEKALDGLPAQWPDDLRAAIKRQVRSDSRMVIVLDDDPTGTQTVHGLPVLTQWSVAILQAEMVTDFSAFYILTNSRSLPLSEAIAVNQNIGRNLVEAARLAKRRYIIISRSDSTLRGHFPAEMAALTQVDPRPYDGWILIPFFWEGGRITIDDIHYVRDKRWLVPAGETEFARDRVFGYTSSDLRQWVAEKTGGKPPADDVISIGINVLRKKGPQAVTRRLMKVSGGRVVVVNAASYRDLEVFTLGLIAAEARGKRFLYRTAASFVQVRGGLTARDTLSPEQLPLRSTGGGLVVVGSHVPNTTRQLNHLLTRSDMQCEEVDAAVLVNAQLRKDEIARVARIVDQALKQNANITLFTSREVLTGQTSVASLDISRMISRGLVDIVRHLTVEPRYIIAKGGVTASDIATHGLNVKRAMILGQILPGVPVWQLSADSRYPGLVYVVFPGNVGGAKSLCEVADKLNRH